MCKVNKFEVDKVDELDEVDQVNKTDESESIVAIGTESNSGSCGVGQ